MDGVGRGFPPGDLRVSDADRDQALAELGEAFRVGRITADEFDERSGQALRARTGNELIALVADLPPGGVPATRTTGPAPANHQVGVRTAVAVSAIGAAALSTVAVAVAASRGPGLRHREFMQAPSPQGLHMVGPGAPAAVAAMLVVLIVFLCVARARRS